MDQRNWMSFKAYLPSLGVFVAAMLFAGVVSTLADVPPLSGVYDLARRMPVCGVLMSISMAVWTAIRLSRWTKGHGPQCSCGGLLGRERDGRYGPYRRCLACGRNLAQRHYAR